MNKSANTQPTRQSKQDRRRERRDEQRRLEMERQRAARNRRLAIGGALLAAIVLIAVAIYIFGFSGKSQTAQTGANATATTGPAPTPTTSNGLQAMPSVDNITCDPNETLTYHVHAHLRLYINGQEAPVPANIGISQAGQCLYWMHTHDSTGVVHIEAPKAGTYTLGTFVRLWQQQFANLQYPAQLSQASGWQVWVDGKPYEGDFHTIDLQDHTIITMAYNTPNVTPDSTYNWSNT